MLDRTNKFKGKCFKCGIAVGSQRGYLIKRDDIGDPSLTRDFYVLCNSRRCVAALIGEEQTEQLDRNAILADGQILVADPSEVKPFLRAMGYYDNKAKCWRAHTHRRDRDHVLRIAAKLGLEVAPEFAAYEDPEPVRLAVERAKAVPTLRDYQAGDIRWLAYCGLDDSQGFEDWPPYQTKGRDRGRLLCLDQGLGKTFEVLFALHDDEGLLVACNKSAKGVWPAEAKKWRPGRFDTFTEISGEENFRWPAHPREMVVINYDILPHTKAQIEDAIEHAHAKLNGWTADADSKVKWKRKDIKSLLAMKRREIVQLRRLCRFRPPTTTGARHLLFLRMEELADIQVKIDKVHRDIERTKARTVVDKPPCAVLIVGDELHYVENGRAQRTQRWRELCKHARRVFGLTGTPFEAEPLRGWGLLTSACANPFSWNGFLEAFNGTRGMWGGFEFARHPPPPGSTAKGSVIVEPGTTEQLQRVMLRHEKKDVAKDLPPKVFQEIPVEISGKVRKELDEFTAQFIGEILEGDIGSIPIAAMSKLRVLLSRACIDTMLDIVESFEAQGTPLVVFSANREPAETLAKRDGWFGVLGGKVHGATKGKPPKDAQDAAERFQGGEGIGVAGTSAAAESLTLTRASHMLQVIPFMARKKNQQAYDRLHRIGQKSTVHVTLLVPEHPFVHHLFALLTAKDQFVEDVLNGETEPDISHVSRFVDEPEDVWRERAMAKVRADADRERRQLEREARAREKQLATLASDNVTPALSEKRAKLRAQRLGSDALDFTAPKRAVQEALAHMLDVCDGARERDHVGFNAPDSAVARWLAPGVEAGKKHAVASAAAILKHYPGQLSERWPELFGLDFAKY